MRDIKKTSVTIHDSITSLINFMNDLQMYVDICRNNIKKDYKKYLSKLPKDMSESLHDQYERTDMLYNKFNKLLNKFSVAIAQDYTDILTVGTEINGLRQKYEVMVAEFNNFITSQYKDANYTRNVKKKMKKFEKVIRKHNKLVVIYNNQIERLNTFDEHLKMNMIIYMSNHKRKFVIPVKDYVEEFESLVDDDTYKARGQVISRYLMEMVGKLNNASPGFPLIPIAKLEKIDFHDRLKAEELKVERDYDLEDVKVEDVGTEWNENPKDFKGKKWNEIPKDSKGKEWNERPKDIKVKEMGKRWNEIPRDFKVKEIGKGWNERPKDSMGKEWNERPKDFKGKEIGKGRNESPKDSKSKDIEKGWNEEKNPKSNENENTDRSTEIVSIKTEPEETVNVNMETDELQNYIRKTIAPEHLDYYNMRGRMWDISPVRELSEEEVNNILEEEDRRKQLAPNNKPFEKTENDYYKDDSKDLRKINEQNTNMLPKNEPYSLDDQSLSSMDSSNEQNLEENENVITDQFENGRSVKMTDMSGAIGPNSVDEMIKNPVQLRKPKPEVKLTRPSKMRRIDSFDYGESEIPSQAELEQYLSGSFENDNQSPGASESKDIEPSQIFGPRFKKTESRSYQNIKSLQEEVTEAEQYTNNKVEQTKPSLMPKLLESKDSKLTKLPTNKRHPADYQSSSSMDSRNDKHFEGDSVVKTEFLEDSKSAPPVDETEKTSREPIHEITREILKEIENRKNFVESENVANKSEEEFGVEKTDDMPGAISPTGAGSLNKKPVQLRKEKPKEELKPRIKKQRTDGHNYEEDSFENDNQSLGTSDFVIERSVLIPNNSEEEVENTEMSDQEDQDEDVEMKKEDSRVIRQTNSRPKFSSNKIRKSKTIDVKKYIDLLKSPMRNSKEKSKIVSSISKEKKPEYSDKIKTQYAVGNSETSQFPISDISDDSQQVTEKLPMQTEEAPSEISDATFSSFSEDSPQVTEKLPAQTEEAASKISDATYSLSSISGDSQQIPEDLSVKRKETPSEIFDATCNLFSISGDSQQVTEKLPAQTEETASKISDATYSSSISGDSQQILEDVSVQREEAPSEISDATYSSSISGDNKSVIEDFIDRTGEKPASSVTIDDSNIDSVHPEVSDQVPQALPGSESSESKILSDDSSSLLNESSTQKQKLPRKRPSEPLSIVRKKLHGKKSKTLQPASENQTADRKRISKRSSSTEEVDTTEPEKSKQEKRKRPLVESEKSSDPIEEIEPQFKKKPNQDNDSTVTEVRESSNPSDQDDYIESHDVKMRPAVEDSLNEIRRRCKFIKRAAKKAPPVDTDLKFKSRGRKVLSNTKNVKPEVKDNEEVTKPDETKRDHTSR